MPVAYVARNLTSPSGLNNTPSAELTKPVLKSMIIVSMRLSKELFYCYTITFVSKHCSIIVYITLLIIITIIIIIIIIIIINIRNV